MKTRVKRKLAAALAIATALLISFSIFAPAVAFAGEEYEGIASIAAINDHMTTPVPALTSTNRAFVESNWAYTIPGLNGAPGHHTTRSTSDWGVSITSDTVNSLLSNRWPSRGLFAGSYDALTIHITGNISTAITAFTPSVSNGRTVRIMSCPVHIANGGEPFTITMNNTLARHFHVEPGGTLILENIILDTGGILSWVPTGSHGGVRVETPGALDFLAFSRVSRLYLGEGSVIQHASATDGGAVQADGFTLGSGHAVVTMLPGSTIQNNAARDGGGGISGGPNSRLRIAGDIKNNTALNTFNWDILDVTPPSGLGGGIRSTDATVEIRGGVISGNEATVGGGGVFVEDNATSIFNTPSINRLFIYGGVIEDNHVRPYSGLPLANQPQVGYGGGVLVRNTTAVIRGGSINHNTAVFGAGIYARGIWAMGWLPITILPLHPRAYVNLHGATDRYDGAIIQDNTARMHAGAVPTRAGYGGGVRACSDATLRMHGGVIQNNYARRGGGVSTGDGGWMYGAFEFGIDPGQFHQFGGSIEHNRATLDGGGVHVTGGRGGFFAVNGTISHYNFAGGRVYSNEAGVDGGGIWIRNNNQMHLGWDLPTYVDGDVIDPDIICIDNFDNRLRPRVENNRAGRDGGGIFHATDTCLRMDRIDIIHNHAGRNGGGLWLATYQNHYWMTASAYNLNGSGQHGITMRPTVWFQGNTAGAGAYVPPVNAAIFGTASVGGGPRMPLSAHISIETGVSEHPHDFQGRVALSHQLNNYDVNHQGFGHVNCSCCCEYCCTEETRDPEHECEYCPCEVCECHNCYVTVIFDPRNGTASQDFEYQNVDRGERASQPSNPVRENYYFVGWFVTPTCECPQGQSNCEPFDFDTAITRDKYLYARWTRIWQVTFSLAGGTYNGTTPLVQHVRNGNDALALTDIPVRTDHIFLGWDANPVDAELTNVTENRVFTARWQHQVQVSFNLHGGGPSVPTQMFPAGMTATQPAEDPTREGFIFVGWYTSQEGGQSFMFGTPNFIHNNTIVHARWESINPGPVNWTVTFLLQGGTYNPGASTYPSGYDHYAPQTVPDGGTMTMPLPPVRIGYAFVGWYTAPTDGQAWVAQTPIYADVTLYARWEEVILVTFDLRGGISEARFDAQAVLYMHSATDPGVPVRPGFQPDTYWIFNGWSLSPDPGGEPIAGIVDTLPIVQNTTFYAIWTPAAPIIDPVLEDLPFVGGRGEPGATLTIILPCDTRPGGYRTVTLTVSDEGEWRYFAWAFTERNLICGDIVYANQSVYSRTSTNASTVVIGSENNELTIYSWYDWHAINDHGHFIGRTSMRPGYTMRIIVHLDNTSPITAPNISVSVSTKPWDDATEITYVFGDIPSRTIVTATIDVLITEYIPIENFTRRTITVIFG